MTVSPATPQVKPMTEEQVFLSRGGRPQILMGADPDDPANTVWNFGINPITVEVRDAIRAQPDLYSRFPNIQGRWDGRTVNHWDAVVKVLGDKAEDLIQNQPRGTCGGRAGSATLDILQCVLMATGQRAKFKRASHAFLYWQARKLFGMASGSPSDENNDGVASGSIPKVLTTVGVDTRDESGDLTYYGAGSDDLATKWGCGQIDPSLAAALEAYAKDNIVTAWAPIRTFDELADGIAAGGVAIGSDNQGFTMTRDDEGFCLASGQWAHYQLRNAVFTSPRGRKGCGYFQSWGKTTPSGPRLPGCPGNMFGVEADTQTRLMSASGSSWAIVFGFPLFELEKQAYDIPWIAA